jgi:hypothetical protein
VIHGANQYADAASIAPLVERYARLLTALRDGTLPLDAAMAAGKINELIPA